MMKLKIWRMQDDERVEIFEGQIKEERFQFVQDGDTTYMVQLDMPEKPKIRGKIRQLEGGEAPAMTARPKAPCPHCGQSFVAGRGLTRHLRSCPKKPKAGKLRKKKAREQAPKVQAQETQTKKEAKEQASG